MAQYDSELQMFVEEARDPDQERLRFLRWLAEQGRLEHDRAGPSSGDYAERERERTPAPV